MRIARSIAAAAALSLMVASPALAEDAVDATATAVAEGPVSSYIVQFTPGSNRAAEVAKAKALGMKVTFEYDTVLNGMAVLANRGQLTALQKNPNVTLVEADGIATISDTQKPATWGLDRIDQASLPLDSSYTYPASKGAGVRAYIIDTGINVSHVEFSGRTAPGYDAVTAGGTAADCDGHGTHVAGTVGGTTYGVAKGVTLVPVRVLDCSGSGSWSGVIAGVNWVASDAKAKGQPAVANMSLGGGYYSTLNTAVANAVASGVTFAVAGGNENTDACTKSPASTPTAITVGSTTSTDARSSFSNYGSCLDIFAPGSSITSAWHTSNSVTNTISGTSMATPHVAGAAALYLADNPTASPATVTSALTSSATANKVTDAKTGSPNRLLFVGTATPPPAVVAPTITSLSVSTGPVGTPVTITGSGFTVATSVTFGGTAATFTVGSDTSISTSVPTGASTGPVVVTNSAGPSSGVSFTVTTSPTVTAPSVPLNLKAANVTRSSATLLWTAPNSGPVGYYEFRRGTSGAWTNVGLSTSVSVTSLKRNTTYTWQVRAVNSAGAGTIAQSSFRTLR